MRRTFTSESAFFHFRTLVGCVLCAVATLLAALSFAASEPRTRPHSDVSTSTVVNSAGWSVITSPNSTSIQQNYLNGVTCVSSSDCWAVGYHASADNGYGPSRTLIEHWNGASWSIIASPNGNLARDNELSGISCVSNADCWASGYYYNNSVDVTSYAQPLLEHWDGVSWSIIRDNSSATEDHYLGDISCPSSVSCWAVGTNGTFTQTLIEHWNGVSWSIANSPPTPSSLSGVTCNSTSDCWAVGSTRPTGSSRVQTLTEHWDGSSWQIVSSPDALDTANNQLYGVTCTSALNCWAVGYYDPHSGDVLYPVIEHWDGSSWQNFSVSTVGDTHLIDVTCSSASDCWAVGSGKNAGDAYFSPRMEHWNGTSWQPIAAPSRTSTMDNIVGSVACAEASRCWAVGHVLTSQTGPDQTLIEEYSSTIPALTSVTSRITHGAAGTFDIDLPLTGSGIEPRKTNGNYSIIFSFVNNVLDCGSAAGFGTSVLSGPNTNQCTENVAGAANQQRVDIGLSSVVDVENNSGSIVVSVGFLVGDTNGDGFVNSGDIAQTKSQSGQTITASNFREDVTADGTLNSGDIALVKSKSGTALP